MRGDTDSYKLSITRTKSDTDLNAGNGFGGKQGVDVQGGATGGYDNPGLSDSCVDIRRSDSQFRGSNDFILNDDGGSGDKRPSKTMKGLGSMVKKKIQSGLTKKMLYRRLPILEWLPKYNSEDAVGDLVAGITVGLTVIPQSLAYANVAGVPTQYGLYGSFLGCFVYIFLGSCKDVPMGPTAIVSLLTSQAIKKHGAEYAILLCFLSGLVQLIMGLIGLGFLLDFVSGPVSSGFTSAVALIIVTSQVKDILAITVTGTTFIEQWGSIFSNVQHTSAWDAVLGITCIAILLIMRIISTIKIGPAPVETDPADKLEKATGHQDDRSGPNTFHKVVNRSLWLFGTSRNAILVVLGGCIGYSFVINGDPPFRVIGDLPPGFPEIKLPPFGFDNGKDSASFLEMLSELGSGIIVIALIGLLENISVCKAFAKGKTVDPTQEFIAIGACNVVNSFVQGYPGSGSLSRSAVNNASGVRTPLGNLYTGTLVIIALIFFTPYFYYVPKATLAAIIIAAVIFMVEVQVVKPIWRTKKSDLIPGLATFTACLALPLQYGIIIGIGTNLLFILYHAARPKISIEKLQSPSGVDYLMLTPDRCLIFPSADYVRKLVTKHSIRQAAPAVIDCSHIYGADYTAATVIETLTKNFAARDQTLIFYNLKPSVSAVFEGLSPKEFVVCYNLDDLDKILKDKEALRTRH